MTDNKLKGGLDQFLENGIIPDNFNDKLIVLTNNDNTLSENIYPKINRLEQ